MRAPSPPRAKLHARLHQENSLQISRKARANTALLRGGIHGDEDKVCLLDSLVNVGGKEQIAPACLAHNVLEPGFVDR